ncbi:hypothetical protein [Thermogymnomonas acidicola]|uniref:hypothetical protein n=1 Tax=Thermogymnomonas acidicola TaxID=399579 RepID=UPI0009466C3E|nr:hypothetical protein [Thermogymnomonas acidicola]
METGAPGWSERHSYIIVPIMRGLALSSFSLLWLSLPYMFTYFRIDLYTFGFIGAALVLTNLIGRLISRFLYWRIPPMAHLVVFTLFLQGIVLSLVYLRPGVASSAISLCVTELLVGISQPSIARFFSSTASAGKARNAISRLSMLSGFLVIMVPLSFFQVPFPPLLYGVLSIATISSAIVMMPFALKVNYRPQKDQRLSLVRVDEIKRFSYFQTEQSLRALLAPVTTVLMALSIFSVVFFLPSSSARSGISLRELEYLFSLFAAAFMLSEHYIWRVVPRFSDRLRPVYPLVVAIPVVLLSLMMDSTTFLASFCALSLWQFLDIGPRCTCW